MNSKSPPREDAPTSLFTPDTPYRGLTPYSEQDAPLFFGREAERELVIANMMASRLTVMYGASGVGKTSLLRAGAAHELLERSQENVAKYGSPEFVVVYFNRWSDDPLTALSHRIHESAGAFASGELNEPSIGSMELAETVHRWSTMLDADLLIILDQFEEYFLYHPDDDGNDSFAVEFPRAVNRADLRVSFLITIREDALARLDRFKGRCPSLFDNYLRTRHLDLAAARAAIEKPLAAYNQLTSPPRPFTAEPTLVQMVLDQVQIGRVALNAPGRGAVEQEASPTFSTQRIETPYLQLVLTRLWLEEIAAGSSSLRAETLRRLGGAQQIVHTHLDEALGALTPRQQDVAAGIFHHLVTASGTKIAHTAPDLADYAQLPEAEVAAVLAELSRGEVRILRPVAPSSARPEADPAYEIFHDVLAPTILDWWTRHTEARATEARLGARLELSAEQTRAAEERAHRYRQWLKRVSIVALVLLLALATSVAALAVQGQHAALRAQATSHSKALAAEALTLLASNPASSLRLALAAMRENANREAASALRRALSEPEVRVLRGHQNWVMSATFSPDGRYVLTAGLDRTVRVWLAASGQQVAMLRTATSPQNLAGHPQFSPDGSLVLITTMGGEVQVWPWQARRPPWVVSRGENAYRAAFSADGNYVVTGHRDGTTRVWAWRTGRLLAVLPATGHPKIVTAVAFSPDGKMVATGGENGAVRLWPWRASGHAVNLVGHTDWVNTLAFSPSGRLLLTSSDDGTARLFDIPDGRLAAVMHGGNPQGLNSAAFSPDGRLVVTAGVDETARVFAVPDGRPVAVLRGHADELEDAAFSPDGKLVATASADGTAVLWSVHTGAAIVVLRGHDGAVNTVAFSPDGRWLVTASEDATARLWKLPVRQVFGNGPTPLNAAVFSPDGRFIATAGEDGTARVYQVGDRPVAVLTTGDRAVDSVGFSPDGRHIVTAGLTTDWSGVARIWNVTAPHKSRVLAREDEEIETAAFSQDGQLLLTSTPAEAVVWDVRTGLRRTTIRLPKAVTRANPFVGILGARFSPDGRWVLTFHYDATARLWSAATGRLVRVLRANTGIVYDAAFSRDGSRVVTANGSGSAAVWDTATGRLLRRLVSPTGQLRSAAFSPDGRWVAAGADDGTMIVWNLSDGQVAAVLQPHDQAIVSVQFSPDGKSILAASDDGTAVASGCDSCRPMQEVLRMARERVQLVGGVPNS